MTSGIAQTPGARAALLAAAHAELVDRGHAAISLRAVARRAGVSHAAPTYFFVDRAGMLTAVATEGFDLLALALRKATAAPPGPELAALGHAYIGFGLANPALFDLMFRPSELHPDDQDLRHAQQRAIELLSAATPANQTASGETTPGWALISWALAHGLTILARDGGLTTAPGAPAQSAAQTANGLIDLYAGMFTSEGT